MNGYTEEEFFAKVREIFETEKVGDAPYHPVKKGEIGMYLKDTWYKLSVRPEMLTGEPVRDLDVALLQNFLLQPVLDILDPKSDGRIDFVGGIRGLKNWKEECIQTVGRLLLCIRPIFMSYLRFPMPGS